MNAQEHYQLPFDPVLQTVEAGMLDLSTASRYSIVIRTFVEFLLEELSAKIWDREATSPVDLAVAYLKKNGVEEDYAARFSHHVLDAMLGTVLGCFPNISFQRLAAARFVLERDNHTLSVYMRPSHETTPY